MSVSSIASKRHQRLLDMLKNRGSLRVDELSEMLLVSAVTIRRDLDYLSDKGLLERRHGGARLISAPLNGFPERNFLEKDVINTVEKEAIAIKALELLDDNEIIFLNSGSTTLIFMNALKDKRLKVFTNNAWAVTCQKWPEVELMLLGGEYREQSRSLIGIMTLEAIENINSNKTFLGTNGISIEKGLTTTVQQECSINQAMINNTNGLVVVLADHTKIGRISNFVSTPIDDIDILITDSGCPEEQIQKFRNRGIKVIVAS
ncbi:MAG: DeoR/GlpR transcriptional regulator [Bacteroidetes bacterium]|nr:DeoR/GlpR transcriptional regulator [Bacteroidota bacterium]